MAGGKRTDITDDRHWREVVSMWKLKFYKAYAKDKKLKRMLAYMGRLKK